MGYTETNVNKEEPSSTELKLTTEEQLYTIRFL